MIAVGETYRPSGAFELRPILVTLILGSATAAVCGLVIWLWEISPIPTLVIITPILQGVVIGLAFHFMIGRLHMRMPWVAGAIAFACGLFTIGLVHYGHHLWVMRQAASEIRTEIAADNELGPQQKQALLADLDQNPNRFVNRVLRGITGHEGFLGTLIIRNKQGVYIRNAQVSGWFLWGLWGAEALFVSIVAASMASSRAAEPTASPVPRGAPRVLTCSGCRWPRPSR